MAGEVVPMTEPKRWDFTASKEKGATTRFLKDAYHLSIFLLGVVCVFTPLDIEARLLGAFLMAHCLTRFGYDATIDRMQREIDELKNN